ncbi:MAG: hypothetical protein ACFKPT_09885 [Gloeotrichia echinulata GP01]
MEKTQEQSQAARTIGNLGNIHKFFMFYHLGLGIAPPLGSFRYDQSTQSVKLTWPKDDPAIVQVREVALATSETLNQGNTTSQYQPKTGYLVDGATAHPLGGAVLVDILPDLKVQGFWIQTAIAGIARLTSPSPTDNALPVATILPKSRPRRTAALDPVFLVKFAIITAESKATRVYMSLMVL